MGYSGINVSHSRHGPGGRISAWALSSLAEQKDSGTFLIYGAVRHRVCRSITTYNFK